MDVVCECWVQCTIGVKVGYANVDAIDVFTNRHTFDRWSYRISH
jgi:hypothetical protein